MAQRRNTRRQRTPALTGPAERGGFRPQAPVGLVASFLVLSGFCALVYQIVWLREFRLLFGAATPATATVLAVFMGGLGVGSLLFGRRAEKTAEPLRVYAMLELAVCASAVATPWVLDLVSSLYHATGGVVSLGPTTGSLFHILLSVVVLGVPCTLMGGTLPVAVKAVETAADDQRGSTGFLYGANALGGFLGVVVSTFWLLERFGTGRTLLIAAGVNGLVAAAAFVAGRRFGSAVAQPSDAAKPQDPQAAKPQHPQAASAQQSNVDARPTDGAPRIPAVVGYAAAFLSGFAFFVCELVWFRMSTPLLGGSVYGFGIILALALAGIGLGGVLYRGVLAPRAGAATLPVFALVSALQAWFIVLPYALGDRTVPLAFFFNQWRAEGFAQQLTGWVLLAALMVPLPSLLAGVQFPLLIGLLGRGATDVGRQLGGALAWNTAGAISGSLLGGFVLIPWLGALGSWRLATWLTLVVAVVALALAVQTTKRMTRMSGVAAVVAVATLWMSMAAVGPTAAWRHNPFGYGRVTSMPETINGLREWIRQARWKVLREFDGRESSVALIGADDTSFMVGGKSDGAAVADAPTQVMGGMVGAVLHPAPHSALVIGMGTGTSAGWLAEVPAMERVDVVEIEPGILDLAAREFAPINRDVMRKANVHPIVGDAREVLSVAGPSYDLIFSEPSNPYRSGIASLFTREFYQAARRRLNADGIFSQWVQGYEIDAATLFTVYATLTSVFPFVETWVTQPSDLLFVCHTTAPHYTVEALRKRLAAPPFDEALRRAWLSDSVEGFLARHFASPQLARELIHNAVAINTDDSNVLEYGFARWTPEQGDVSVVNRLLVTALGRKLDLPSQLVSKVDAARIAEERMLMLAVQRGFQPPAELVGEAIDRADAIAASAGEDFASVLTLWRGEPEGVTARLMMLEATSNAGTTEQARPYLEWARGHWSTEAHFAAAALAARDADADTLADRLTLGFTGLRTDPWVRWRVTRRSLLLVQQFAAQIPPERRPALFDALSKPFLMNAANEDRLVQRVELSKQMTAADRVAAADGWGQFGPWSEGFLEFRRDVFAEAGDSRLPLAEAELAEFLARERE